MILVDAIRWLGVAVVVAVVVHQMLALLRDARWLDDHPWEDTPGGRNDRRALLEDRSR